MTHLYGLWYKNSPEIKKKTFGRRQELWQLLTIHFRYLFVLWILKILRDRKAILSKYFWKYYFFFLNLSRAIGFWDTALQKIPNDEHFFFWVSHKKPVIFNWLYLRNCWTNFQCQKIKQLRNFLIFSIKYIIWSQQWNKKKSLLADLWKCKGK